jgi:ectoine hydroxylase-related dioxygenase (phytanoyl-CoA dioxygenase family)
VITVIPKPRAVEGIDQVAPDETERAVTALQEDGAVIVRDAVDPTMLERLFARMSQDLTVLMASPYRAENFASGHLQQDAPPEAELLWPEVLAHPFALEVCRAVMRQPLRLSAYTNNSNLPGSGAQAVHVDEGQRWPGLTEAHPPARLTVNIPLTKVDAAGGAIELWPGTHRDTRLCQYSATPEEGVSRALQYVRAAKRAGVDRRVNRRVGLTVPEELLRERRAQRPPVRATTEAGSLIIRDPRLWHRGMPNESDRCRFMLAITYDPVWRRPGPPMELPRTASAMFEALDLEVHASYVDDPIDYLGRHRPAAGSPFRRPRPTGGTS